MKKIVIFGIILSLLAGLAGCAKEAADLDTPAQDAPSLSAPAPENPALSSAPVQDPPEQDVDGTPSVPDAPEAPSNAAAPASDAPKALHEDVPAESIRRVRIGGNARSLVIRPGAGETFAFLNEDLVAEHVYNVRCGEDDGLLDIDIQMEDADAGNDILGSVVLEVPQKAFEEIEISGQFRQLSLHTLDSDVVVQAGGVVNLDLEAARLTHDITLSGTDANAFGSVSLYFDRFPDNVKLELDAAVHDPMGLLEKNGTEAGAGQPVIHVSQADEINIYSFE